MRDNTLIGTVQNVDGASISVELADSTVTGMSFVNGEGYRVGQIGSFVKIPIGHVNLYGVVSQVGAGSVPLREGVENPYGKRWLTVQLVGEGRRSGEFQRGLSQHPTIDDRVHIVTESDLRSIYGPGDRSNFVQVGHLASAESIPALVDITKLVTRHSAIVGTTGSGKSHTVAGILHSLAAKNKYPSARIIVLDIHGEYGRALASKSSVFKIDPDAKKGQRPLFVPFWALRFAELENIVLKNLGEKPATIVAESVLEKKRAAAKTMGILGLPEHAITVDAPLPFSLRSLWFELYVREHQTTIPTPGSAADEVQLAYTTDASGKVVDVGDSEEIRPPQFRTVKQTGSASERVQWGKESLGIRSQLAALAAMLRDPRFDFMLNPGPWAPDASGKVSEDSLLESWIGGPEPVTVLDLSGVPPAVLTSLVGALLRIVYDAMFWSKERSEGGIERPLLFVLEEAHTYIGKDDSGPASDAVKRIAKEGRKYGVGLMLVSQRPAEIDPTILSQCGTIFAMRLANDIDRGHVTSAASDNLKGLLDMLPVLRTGEAIIVGEAVSLPIRTVIDRLPKEQRPDSDDPRVVDRMLSEQVGSNIFDNIAEGPGGWNRSREDGDYVGVVQQMRHQVSTYLEGKIKGNVGKKKGKK